MSCDCSSVSGYVTESMFDLVTCMHCRGCSLHGWRSVLCCAILVQLRQMQDFTFMHSKALYSCSSAAHRGTLSCCLPHAEMMRMWTGESMHTSNPGSYALMPSCNAFSMSMVPQILSSVAPSGSSTCDDNTQHRMVYR